MKVLGMGRIWLYVFSSVSENVGKRESGNVMFEKSVG